MELLQETHNVEISLSFLEVYNETVRDLFQPSKVLELREDHERIHVAGIYIYIILKFRSVREISAKSEASDEAIIDWFVVTLAHI